MTRSHSKTRPVSAAGEALPHLHPEAAGLASGAEEIWACVPGGRDAQSVRCFGTLTPDLQALAAGLARCRVKTVAMEATGV